MLHLTNYTNSKSNHNHNHKNHNHSRINNHNSNHQLQPSRHERIGVWTEAGAMVMENVWMPSRAYVTRDSRD